MRSTRTLARRRRLAHHGMPHAMVSATAMAGIGGVAGPIAVAVVSQPPVAVCRRRRRRRVRRGGRVWPMPFAPMRVAER